MEKLQFGDSEERYPIQSIKPSAVHVMEIIYADTMPDESVYTEPITIYSNGDIKESTLTGWNTVYKTEEENLTIYLSDDESVYTEPEEQEPGPQENPEPYEPTVEELQTYKISQMQSTCANTIKAGIDVNGEHFSLDSEARLALIIREFQIENGAIEIDFYPDGAQSKYYTAEEMQTIIDAANDLINYNDVYCNELCLWIETLTDKDEIEAVYYGMDIPQANRSEVLEKMLPIGDDETGMIPQDEGGDEPEDDDDNDTSSGGSFNDDNSEEVGNN